MEVKIGVQRVPREVLVESDLSADEVTTAVTEAMASGTPLVLNDTRGQRVVIPSTAIGYVDIAGEAKGRVGFGG